MATSTVLVALVVLPSPSALSTARARARAPTMLARKPFKGGDLGEFLKAGEAEAKLGPRRYAAVREDLWKLDMENKRVEDKRQQSLEAYSMQKAQILQDHALLSALGLAAFWSWVTPQATASCKIPVM